MDEYGVRPRYNLERINKRTEELYALKFGAVDAIHIAFAEITSDYFITCDDKIVKKANKLGLTVCVLNPVEFCLKENLK